MFEKDNTMICEHILTTEGIEVLLQRNKSKIRVSKRAWRWKVEGIITMKMSMLRQCCCIIKGSCQGLEERLTNLYTGDQTHGSVIW